MTELEYAELVDLLASAFVPLFVTAVGHTGRVLHEVSAATVMNEMERLKQSAWDVSCAEFMAARHGKDLDRLCREARDNGVVVFEGRPRYRYDPEPMTPRKEKNPKFFYR